MNPILYSLDQNDEDIKLQNQNLFNNKLDGRTFYIKIETYELSTEPETSSVVISKGARLLCRFQENNRVKWDLFIMLLAIFNCIQVPYTIAFLEEGDGGIILFLLNQIIDLIFIADLILSFRTTYISEETGIEVFDPKMIAIQYLKGRSCL